MASVSDVQRKFESESVCRFCFLVILQAVGVSVKICLFGRGGGLR